MTIATKTTSDDTDLALAEHRLWLSTYYELVAVSSGGFTVQGDQLPLTDDQRAAYRAIPSVLDSIEEAWALMDDAVRPAHYLTSV